MDDFKGMLYDSDCHELLAIVAPMHHQRISQTLHHRTLQAKENRSDSGHRLQEAWISHMGLPESLCCISPSGVRQVHRAFLLDRDVVLSAGARAKRTDF